MHIAREVKVDVVGGHDLGPAAPGGAALEPEDGPQGRFPQGDDGLLPETAEGVGQADGRRRLALAGGRRGHGRDHDELAPDVRRARELFEQDLGLDASARDQEFLPDAELGGDLPDGP